MDIARVERRVTLGGRAERVEVRPQVPVHAVGLDHRGRGLDGLEHGLVGLIPHLRSDRRGDGLIGGDRAGAVGVLGLRRRLATELRRDRFDTELREHGLVEAVLARQELLDAPEEGAGLRALDHAVVVGARDRHRLRDPELAELLGIDALEARGVADRAGGDDRALAGHQPRHRGDRPDSARVGQRQVGTRVGLGRERAVARAGHERVVAADEAGDAQ